MAGAPAVMLTTPSRREFLASAVGLLQPQSRNVLFIAVDDLRPKLGCYGDRTARTPNIDRLAARSLLFERAYCQQAVCAPSRASLLTGLRPDTTRVYDLKTTFRKAIPDAVTLPEYFKKNGYHTESIGKIFHGDPLTLDRQSWSVPEQFPILPKRDQYVLAANKDDKDPWKKTSALERVNVPDEAYRDGRISESALEALSRLRNRPFFLGVGFNKPHLPFAAPARYWDLYRAEDLPLAPNPYLAEDASAYALQAYSELRSYGDFPDKGPVPETKMRAALHGYYACVSYIDAQVGKLLDALDRLGLEKNTVIALWGDHGWHLGEQNYWGKTTNFEVCVRAPLLLSIPGENSGQRTRALTEFVDIYPTLTDACGLPPPKDVEGISIMPLFRNPGLAWKKAAFSQYPRPGDVMGYSMRTDRYRFTEWISGKGDPVSIELYDHERDPNETRNIAGEPHNRALVAELARTRKSGWQAALPEGVRR
jgi:arylsulfatase A-like enzyme